MDLVCFGIISQKRVESMSRVLLAHGDGGLLTHNLIKDLFLEAFDPEILCELSDAAGIDCGEKMAFATDSFVVDPIFFPGGNIGKLAVAGTVNDLAVYGAVPKYISVGFILEEGLPLEDLRTIAYSLGETARAAGVKIAAGDTKVVEKGKLDKIFINTSGIGELLDNHSRVESIQEGDAVIVSGNVGDHGAAIISRRAGIGLESDIVSDCAALNHIVIPLWQEIKSVRLMRDPTRGGVATTLKEIAEAMQNKDIELLEEDIPIDAQVKAASELLGLDPLYLANEGKFLLICGKEDAGRAMDLIRSFPEGRNARVIGSVIPGQGNVRLRTPLGGTKLLDMLAGAQLPRIC